MAPKKKKGGKKKGGKKKGKKPGTASSTASSKDGKGKKGKGKRCEHKQYTQHTQGMQGTQGTRPTSRRVLDFKMSPAFPHRRSDCSLTPRVLFKPGKLTGLKNFISRVSLASAA